ncbi:DivIVA domain-containing protein [Enteractinococcus coprophilus]|uniref:Cell wall synthesis protein Wag31 n=1 Tax=Enteractinococcus coprophilus TaxID=1027633 RepID=A0A543AJU6_9MICC|nr:DivIVA domain-containing protein [Enteractinococcus coprophilus]TQL72832.1 DivIVA domain-containing protein [Enteractinococcus coprophilus]
MALTPEVVVNKKFQVTKFREGYDQDEVDDFLDEIVEELRRLNQENDELRRQVAELETQTGESAPVPAPVPADGLDDESTAADLPVVEAEPVVEQAVVEPEPEIVEAAPAAPAEPAHESTAESAAGVLAMAQRLHDEYVAEGERKRDEIISEAEREANRMVTEAQETSRKTLDELEKRKTILEREVEELRGFERDYRSRLRAFIENQLQDLDSQARVTD